VKRITYTELRLRLSFAGYRKLKKLADSQKYKLHLKKSGGIPLKIIRAKKRIAILPAAVFLVFALFVASTFVWDVKYSGFDAVNPFEVRELLENMGLKTGAKKDSINREAAEKAVMENFDGLAWVNIYFMGTELNIQVVEADQPEKMVEDTGVRDLVAQKDGYITELRVYAGTLRVTEGQTVRAGQVLISGDITAGGALIGQGAARGEVFAQTTYVGVASKPLMQIVAQKTGSVYNMKYIRLGGRLYSLTREMPAYKEYVAEVQRVTVVGENMPVFFKIYDVLISETMKASVPADKKALSAELEETAYNQALAGGVDPDDITGVNVVAAQSDTDMKILVIIEATEEISQAQDR
jgi:similar to stage IV sporulation protein